MASLLNGARMCTTCGVMSPSPSDDRPYADWILHHVVKMECAKKGPTIVFDDL